MDKGFAVEGDEGVEVAFARYGFVCEKQYGGDDKSRNKTPDVEKHRQYQKHNADELDAVAKLVVGL